MATNENATEYLSAMGIKVYPAVNSENGGDLNTEYNAKTLAKSSSSRNYMLSGFQVVGSTNENTLILGSPEEEVENSRIIRGSLILDGYYVEIYKNLVFNYEPDSSAVMVFAIPHYALNQNTDRVKWEKSQHLTGMENDKFQGIRFECVSAKYVDNNSGDWDYDPTHYSYTDDSGNNLPSYSLLVGFVAYDSQTSKYTSSYMQYARWQHSKINANDVALPELDSSLFNPQSEHRYSSLVPIQTGTSTVKYPHTLAEYLKNIDDVYVHKYIDDTKCGKLYFQNTSSSASEAKRGYIENNNDKLIINVENTESRLVEVVGDLTAERVFNAVYNDYAEFYKKDDIDEEINPGDVIELNPETGNYRKCKTAKSRLVVGICSNSYGYVVGGELGTIEDNLISYIPVGISGRVYANTDDETCEPGDLVMSTNEGKVATYKNVVSKVNGVLDDDKTGRILGKCLSKTENGKVLIQIMLG